MIKVHIPLAVFTIVWLLFLNSCWCRKSDEGSNENSNFTFIFMTDIHLQSKLNAIAGFNQAIDSVNKINPDFVITGGDLIMDALGQNFERADSLYDLYLTAEKKFNMPVYNTMGNHEIFGIYNKSGVPKSHPLYGEKLFEEKIGKRYYSFDHKGWHFMVLDGIEDTGENSYIGMIDSTQMEWIRSDLSGVDAETPIVVSVHIPLLTVITQLEKGALKPNGKGTVVNNAKEVISLFDNHNLKLALQGHLHYLEDIYVKDIHFITGGAISGKWWSGPYMDTQEGFVVVHVSGNNFSWNYFDYGWDPIAKQKN